VPPLDGERALVTAHDAIGPSLAVVKPLRVARLAALINIVVPLVQQTCVEFLLARDPLLLPPAFLHRAEGLFWPVQIRVQQTEYLVSLPAGNRLFAGGDLIDLQLVQVGRIVGG
jgi:hypothetical protein